MPEYKEIGQSGLKQYGGFIEEAYHADLQWPQVQPLYSKMRRSDPEVSIVRGIYSSLARRVDLIVELPDNPTPDDQKAGEFLETVLEDMSGGQADFLDSILSNVPFYGWGVWNHVWGVRDPDWKPPNGDPWRSSYNDGLIGVRRLAIRDTSSFVKWEFDDFGRPTGMVQSVPQSFEQLTIPLSKCCHVTFGDSDNPEGLSPLEAVWRLERIKYGLEIIQGIGFEHSAGHLSVKAEEELTDSIDAQIRRAARNILTAQEGNYAVWPKGFSGEIIDSNFSAGSAILEAIRYFGILKLMIYNMQWVAIASTSGVGSYSAMSDSSSMFMVTFNAMMDGFISQIDAQLVRRLFDYNRGAFPGMTQRPKLKAKPIEKVISLQELGNLLAPLKNTMPLGDEDFKAIRSKTGFLPETLPETETTQPATQQPETTQTADNPPKDDGEGAPIPQDQEPVDDAEVVTDSMLIHRSMLKWREYARQHEPEVYSIITRQI